MCSSSSCTFIHKWNEPYLSSGGDYIPGGTCPVLGKTTVRISVRGEIDFRGTRMLSPTRLGWSPREAADGARERRRPAHVWGALPVKIFEKMIAGNAFSKHFRRFLVTAQTKSSFIPDNSRLAGQFTDETTPLPIPYPKTPRQMAVLAISSYFRVFVFSLKFLAPPGPPPRTPMIVRRCECREPSYHSPCRSLNSGSC